MSETREEQAKRLDAYAELCYGDSPVVQANRDAFRAGAEALRGPGWQPIATAPKDGTVILRPHRIWGAMDVRYLADEQRHIVAQRGAVLSAGIQWEWLNGDYTTAWTESAFLPFWQPLPSPPVAEPEPRA